MKCWPKYFTPIIDRVKVCEMRRCDDRTFKVGDAIKLREYNHDTKEYTGRMCCVWITHVLGPFNADLPMLQVEGKFVKPKPARVPHVVLSLSFMREDAIMADILADKPKAQGL